MGWYHSASAICATASRAPTRFGPQIMGSGLPAMPYVTHINAFTRFMRIIGTYIDSLRGMARVEQACAVWVDSRRVTECVPVA